MMLGGWAVGGGGGGGGGGEGNVLKWTCFSLNYLPSESERDVGSRGLGWSGIYTWRSPDTLRAPVLADGCSIFL